MILNSVALLFLDIYLSFTSVTKKVYFNFNKYLAKQILYLAQKSFICDEYLYRGHSEIISMI